MARLESERSHLEKVWSEAFAEYTQEVKRTLAMLDVQEPAAGPQIEALEQQRIAERRAFERYRRARRAYIEFLQGAGGFVIAFATQLLAARLR